MDQRFPREHRLKLKQEFDRVFDLGRRLHSRHFMVVAAPGPELEHHRLGISVGRKVGKAVTRNKIKRMVREYYRTAVKNMELTSMPGGADFVVVVRPGAAELVFADIVGELESCFRKLQ